MKNIFTLLLAFITFAATAQFSIQPQLGLENSSTIIKSNEFSSFRPMGMQFAPRVSVRMDYKLKTGSGAFIGIATSTSAVEFKFNDPQTARTSYKASAKDLQLRLEGGYQFTSKPIALGKSNSSNRSESHTCGGGEQHRCGGHMACGKHNSSNRYSNFHKSMAQNKGWYMRIQPSAGLAFLPSGKNEIETETKNGQLNYEYKAAWNTAFIAGTAFEFGSRNQPKFTVSLNYLKGFGNNMQTLNTVANGKTTASTFSSKTSGFNVSLGIPISLTKNNKATKHHPCNRSHSEGHHCG